MKVFTSFLIIIATAFLPMLSSAAFAQDAGLNANLNNYDPTTFDSWLTEELKVAEAKMLQAMSNSDTAAGVVVASPSRTKPDYYYHWVRDAALTMDVVVELYKNSTKSTEKGYLSKKIQDYINFSRWNQNSNTLTGIGEPKFFVNGQPYNLPWGRPQNDGPALRAMTLIKYANLMIDAGQMDYVRNTLYDGYFPTNTIIKADLEYVSNHWQESSFDLWEEVMGDHFFTRIVQRAALLQGAKLAQRLGDPGASDWYLRQAAKLEASLTSNFLSSKQNFIPATLNFRAGLNTKKSNIDVAVLLGILRGNNHDGFLDFSDARVLGTVNTLIQTFTSIYPINQIANVPGAGIGRYPEDVYDGDAFQGGNPWVLATLAVAEAYYEISIVAQKNPKLMSYASQLFDNGERFFQRVQVHANPDGSLSEQISRYNGYMTSAIDLTWNYAAVLTANSARVRAKAALTK